MQQSYHTRDCQDYGGVSFDSSKTSICLELNTWSSKHHRNSSKSYHIETARTMEACLLTVHKTQLPGVNIPGHKTPQEQQAKATQLETPKTFITGDV